MFYDDLYAFYDLINPGRDEEHAYYRNLIAETDDVLEVACGSGSLTSEIAKFARSVVGIDISPKMLEIARLRVPGAEFLETDMRSFEVDKIFDKVICPFNSFMHMHSDKDAVAALSLFRAHCKPTGQIVVDMFDIDINFFDASTCNVQLAECMDPVSGRHVRLYEDSRLDPDGPTIEITVRVVDTATKEEVTRSTYAMRIYRPDHMRSLFLEAGLTPVTVKANYNSGARQQEFRQIHIGKPTTN